MLMKLYLSLVLVSMSKNRIMFSNRKKRSCCTGFLSFNLEESIFHPRPLDYESLTPGKRFGMSQTYSTKTQRWRLSAKC